MFHDTNWRFTVGFVEYEMSGRSHPGDTGWRGYEVTDAKTNYFDYTVKLRISKTPDPWFLDLCFSEAPAKLMKCGDDSCVFGNGKTKASGYDRR